MRTEARAATPTVATARIAFPEEGGEREAEALEAICKQSNIEIRFQPVIRMTTGEILGYEAKPHPGHGVPFSNAKELFAAASRNGSLAALELACCAKAVARFVKLGLQGKLLLGMSPSSIVEADLYGDSGFEFLRPGALEPGRVVVQLAEQQSKPNLEQLCEAVMLLRSRGAEIAISDEGFTSIWLWGDFRPELVKVSVHFVKDVHRNAIRFQFLKAIQQIADVCGSRLVAEGINDKSDYAALLDIGIAFGQGSFIARAAPVPVPPKREIADLIRSGGFSSLPQALQLPTTSRVTGEKILVRVPAVVPGTPCENIFDAFDTAPELQALPVVVEGRPVGLISRNSFLRQCSKPDNRELFGRLPCERFMNTQPLLVEKRLSIHEISALLIREELRHVECFIFTDQGAYAGIGMGRDLIREITLLQLEAARYANPLTLLPGNVPIDEHIAALLEAKTPFVVAYCDINHFKAFNDAYGYRRGDEMIRLAARTLSAACDGKQDFIGHIGGDDFLLVFRSDDWKSRCERALATFARQSQSLFDQADWIRGTLKGEDRSGRPLYSPLTTLAIGAVPVDPETYGSHLRVAEAATEAKKQAKRMGGNALFVERRTPTMRTRSGPEDAASASGQALHGQ